MFPESKQAVLNPPDHFSAQADDYAKFRPTYPYELFAWIASQSQNRRVAWDAATGNGQAAVCMAEFFERVIATDMSEDQLRNAIRHPAVEYHVSSSEQTNIPESSVDVVSVAAAVHWFEFEKFYNEVRRVAKPDAKIFLWTYDEVLVSDDIDPLVRHFYRNIVGPYWPKGREWVEQKYETLPFSFAELSVPRFEIHRRMTPDTFLGYLGTWSSVMRYRKELGRDPLIEIEDSLRALWGEKSREVRWPIFMRAGIIHGGTK